MSDENRSINNAATDCDSAVSSLEKILREAGVTIVIGRQYGCGGRMLGHILARRLDIPYFDKELLSAAAERLGIDPKILERIDERKPSLIRSIFTMASGAASGDYSVSSMNAENLYAAQGNVISQINSEGACVFVGRTADYILRDNPRMFSIFLHASDEERIDNICNRLGMDDRIKALELARKHDRARRDYYNYFTGRDWGMAANYDLCLDTTGMDMEHIADIVIRYIAYRLPSRLNR